MRRWQQSAAFASNTLFQEFLADHALGEADLLRILGTSPDALGRRAAAPAWMRELRTAFAPARSRRGPSEPAASHGFLALVEPLLARASSRLGRAAGSLLRARVHRPIDPKSVVRLFRPILDGRILAIVQRTLILELNAMQLRGELPGTPDEQLRRFTRCLRTGKARRRILSEHPVLGRLCVEACDLWLEASVEFLRRLAADLPGLQRWEGGSELGRLVAIEGGAAETHHGGRSVLIAVFSSGRRIVYKPRSLSVERHLAELIEWLNARGLDPALRANQVLDRGAYGWVEYSAQRDCASLAEVERFYRRQGAWLAILHAVAGRDLHYENVVASGEHPAMVDLEMVFQPVLTPSDVRRADQRADEALLDSVLSVGLLPSPRWVDGKKVDTSGLGAAPDNLSFANALGVRASAEGLRLERGARVIGAVHSRPTLQGRLLPLASCIDAVESGYRAAYVLLLAHRDALLAPDGPLARFCDDPVRVIVRPTARYTSLLEESCHPKVLGDALERERLLSQVWGEVAARPVLRPIVPSELRQLRRQDVPYFCTRPSSRDLLGADGEVVPSALARSGLSVVEGRLRRMGEEDLAFQSWVVRASLTSSAGDAPGGGDATSRGPSLRPRGGFLESARAVGAWLERTAHREGGGASWVSMGLDRNPNAAHDRNYSLRVLGDELYDGLAGVVLFLAHLGRVSGDDRYEGLARGALATLELRAAPAAARSMGAFSGVGGFVYVYTHLASLWGEAGLLDKAFDLLPRLDAMAPHDQRLDVIAGCAGCVPVLLGLERLRPNGLARASAIRCGERILAAAAPGARGGPWRGLDLARGFSHGSAGLAQAFGSLFAATGERRYEQAAVDLTRWEEELLGERWTDLQARGAPAQSTWCHGANGIALSRLLVHRSVGGASLEAQARRALEAALELGAPANHSLCHGQLGNLEPILLASRTLPDRARWTQVFEEQSQAVLEDVQRGCRSALPNHVETPGLMLGLAGVGYGLLRCAAPDAVPSVLALEPPSLR